MAYERIELSPRTFALLVAEYPHMTIKQLDRFAAIAQQYRELKSELLAQRAQRMLDNDLTRNVPHFIDAASVGCPTARCAAQGEADV
jgi:hypothetical protein